MGVTPGTGLTLKSCTQFRGGPPPERWHCAAVCSDSLHSSAASSALWCARKEVNDPELQRQLAECTQRLAFVRSTKARHWRSARGGPQVTRRFAPLLLLFLLLGSGCFVATGQSTVTAAEARKHHNPSRKFKPAVAIAPLFPNGPPDLSADVVSEQALEPSHDNPDRWVASAAAWCVTFAFR